MKSIFCGYFEGSGGFYSDLEALGGPRRQLGCAGLCLDPQTTHTRREFPQFWAKNQLGDFDALNLQEQQNTHRPERPGPKAPRNPEKWWFNRRIGRCCLHLSHKLLAGDQKKWTARKRRTATKRKEPKKQMPGSVRTPHDTLAPKHETQGGPNANRTCSEGPCFGVRSAPKSERSYSQLHPQSVKKDKNRFVFANSHYRKGGYDEILALYALIMTCHCAEGAVMEQRCKRLGIV